MASVHRTRTNWRACWSIERDGKRAQRSRSFATRREALSYAREAERLYEKRGVAAADNLNTAQLAERFLAWCDGRVQQSTLHRYRSDLALLTRHVGHVLAARLTAEHLDAAYSILLRNGGAAGR